MKGKAWGATEEIFARSGFSLNLLKIKRGGYSSEHRHRDKANLFRVISGKLEVLVFPAGSRQPDSTVLGPGGTTEVEPGTWHKFNALEDTVCLEIYTGQLVGEDIERRSRGGLNNHAIR